MTNKLEERVAWIERNIIPYEREIRAWLSRHRLYDLDVDDIVQEMYARVGTVEDFQLIRAPKNYAFQVAHSILLNHVRRPQIVIAAPNGNLEDLNVPSLEATPEDKLAILEEAREVAHAIAAMPARTRKVLILRRLEGLSQRETAQKLDIAEKTVEKHLARAVMFLMERFGRGGKLKPHASNLSSPACQHDDPDEV